MSQFREHSSMRQTAEILENSANNYLTAKLDLESPLTQTRLAFVEEQLNKKPMVLMSATLRARNAAQTEDVKRALAHVKHVLATKAEADTAFWLKAENETLHERIKQLEEQLDRDAASIVNEADLETTNKKLKTDNQELKSENERVVAKNEKLDTENQKLEDTVKKLKDQLAAAARSTSSNVELEVRLAEATKTISRLTSANESAWRTANWLLQENNRLSGEDEDREAIVQLNAAATLIKDAIGRIKRRHGGDPTSSATGSAPGSIEVPSAPGASRFSDDKPTPNIKIEPGVYGKKRK